jgi:hypothetical protein
MEAAGFSEILVPVYQITWHHVSKYYNNELEWFLLLRLATINKTLI